jgi:hypothetical protein
VGEKNDQIALRRIVAGRNSQECEIAIRQTQVRHPDRGLTEVRRLKDCPAQVRPGQVRNTKVRRCKVSLDEVGLTKVRICEGGSSEVHSAQVCTREHCSGQICPSEARRLKACLAQVRSAQVCIKQYCSDKIGTAGFAPWGLT